MGKIHVSKIVKIVKTIYLCVKEFLPLLFILSGSVILNRAAVLLGNISEYIYNILQIKIEISFSLLLLILPIMIYLISMEALQLIEKFQKPSLKIIKYKEWHIGWNYNRKREVINIRPLCKKHECELENHLINGSLAGLYCPVCGENSIYPYFYSNDRDAAIKVIHYEITKKRL